MLAIRAGEMIQQIRVYTVLEEDLSSVPRTFTGQLTTVHNYSSRGSNALFWPL